MQKWSEKTKYKIIYIVVAIVMAFRCMRAKTIIEDETVLSIVLMIVLYFLFIIWGVLVSDRIVKNGNKNIFVILILFVIFATGIYTAEDYVGSVESIIFTLSIVVVYVVAICSNRKIIMVTSIIVAALTLIFYVVLRLWGSEDIVKFWSYPALYVIALRIMLTLLLTSPFIVFAIIVFKKMLDRAKIEGTNVGIYKLWMCGGLLAVPLFFMGNNYGTWFFALFSYYLIGIIGLIVVNDKIVTGVLSDIFKTIREKCAYLILLLIYAVMFTPIDSVKVCTFVDNFINWDL